MEFCSRRLEKRAEKSQLINCVSTRDYRGAAIFSGLGNSMLSLSTKHEVHVLVVGGRTNTEIATVFSCWPTEHHPRTQGLEKAEK